MLRWLLMASVLAAALAGCLIVAPGVTGGDALLVSADLGASDGYRVLVIPQVGAHYRGLRFEAEPYPIEVYRVVLVYRSGEQESFPVHWRFAQGPRDRDLHIGRDRDVREVRLYYRPLDGRGNEQRRGRATITVYGIL